MLTDSKYRRSVQTIPNTWTYGGEIIWWPPEVKTHYQAVRNSYVSFRKVFDLAGDVRDATIHIFADSLYQLFINGQYVARGPARSDPRWQSYDSISVASYLRPGKNCIAVLALHYGYSTGQSISRIPALLASLDVLNSDGKATRIVTDSSWRCKKSDAFESNAPRINGCQGTMVVLNMQKWNDDWHSIDYDDSSWVAAKGRSPIYSPFWNLTPRDIPMFEQRIHTARTLEYVGQITAHAEPIERLDVQIINEETTLKLTDTTRRSAEPITLPPSPAGLAAVVAYDLSEVIAGYLQLDVTGRADTVVDVVFGEVLVNGQPAINPDSYRPINRYILRDGENRIEVPFDWKAARYIQLIVRNPDSDVQISKVAMRSRRYPLAATSTFECSDPALNKLWKISERTVRLCLQDAIVDSPSREQQQWMGDARWQAMMAYYLSGDTQLFRRVLQQFAQSQDYQGMTCSRYPDGHHNYPPIPSFCLTWVSAFGDYLADIGDLEFIAECWPNLLLAMRWFTGFENADGLLENVPYWMFIDWSELLGGGNLDIELRGITTSLNILYLETQRVMADLAERLGDHEARKFYTGQHTRLEQSIQDQLWNSSVQAYPDRKTDGQFSSILSETTHSLALLHLHQSGSERAAKILDKIFIHPDKEIRQASPYFMMNVAHGLYRHGHVQSVLDFIRKRYACVIADGPGTLWEKWLLIAFRPDGTFDSCSACHGWGAMPLYFFIRSVLGVQPVEPGFRRIHIKPNLGDLEFAKGSIPTRDGRIEIELQKTDRGLHVQLKLPSGISAETHNGKVLAEGSHAFILTP